MAALHPALKASAGAPSPVSMPMRQLVGQLAAHGELSPSDTIKHVGMLTLQHTQQQRCAQAGAMHAAAAAAAVVLNPDGSVGVMTLATQPAAAAGPAGGPATLRAVHRGYVSDVTGLSSLEAQAAASEYVGGSEPYVVAPEASYAAQDVVPEDAPYLLPGSDADVAEVLEGPWVVQQQGSPERLMSAIAEGDARVRGAIHAGDQQLAGRLA